MCRNREGNDRYVERGANTLNEVIVDKIVGSEPCEYKVTHCLALVKGGGQGVEGLGGRSPCINMPSQTWIHFVA